MRLRDCLLIQISLYRILRLNFISQLSLILSVASGNILEQRHYFMRSDMVPKSGYSVNELPEVEKSDTLNVCGCNMVHKKQLPVNPFTDAELVEYMEQNGLGTVSSRTNIIRTLVNRKYIRYSGKYIVPTPKGMFTYETIRGKKIADTSLTADWEKQLAGLESGMITGQDFLNRIRTLAKEMTDDIFNTYSTKEE